MVNSWLTRFMGRKEIILSRMQPMATAAERLVEARRKVSKMRALRPVQADIESSMETGWKAQSRAFLKEFESLQRSWPEAIQEGRRLRTWLLEAVTEGDIDPLFDKAAKKTFKLFSEPLTEAAAAAVKAGAFGLVARLGIDYSFDLANPRAAAYLKTYGALLVKQINETTMSDIRTTVTYGLENGWSYTKTAKSLQERFKGYYEPGSWWNFDSPRPQGHIASRAHLVAVTESGNAYEVGNYVVVKDLAAAGIQMEKKWSTMGDDKVSDECRKNGEDGKDGWIPEDQAHSSGDMHPLRFPGCRCDEYYQVKED